ncbi:MAG: cytochrome c [Proteobacteria bacterium]|nr:cytochrome c [Pseudomonadota bacterium]
MAVTRILPILALVLIATTGFLGDRAFAGDLMAGKAKAEAACQVCHGLDGRAVVPMAANLSGQQKQYIIAQLEAYRSGRRRHEQMSIIAQMLDDDDIENLAEWYSSITITIEMPN